MISTCETLLISFNSDADKHQQKKEKEENEIIPDENSNSIENETTVVGRFIFSFEVKRLF